MQQSQTGAIAQPEHHPAPYATGGYCLLQPGAQFSPAVQQARTRTGSVAGARAVEAASGMARGIEVARPANELPVGPHAVLGAAHHEQHPATLTGTGRYFQQQRG